MIELAPGNTSAIARISGQPIAIAATAFAIIVLGIGSITLWRAYTGTAPETERVAATGQGFPATRRCLCGVLRHRRYLPNV